MSAYLTVFLGAGLGGALRHAVNIAFANLTVGFPWGTLTVNAVGSFLLGALAGWLALRAGADWVASTRLFLATGLLGGFTTFSAFSLDAVLLWERGHAVPAAAYVAGSVVLSIAGVLGGLALVRILTS